jgi:hypothetical protein
MIGTDFSRSDVEVWCNMQCVMPRVGLVGRDASAISHLLPPWTRFVGTLS